MVARKGNRRRGKRKSRASATRPSPRTEPTGIIQINRRGYAFVVTPEGDFFIPADRLGGAFNGDLVCVRPHSGAEGVRRRAVVSHVIARNTASVIGTYKVDGALGVVIPSDVRIPYDIFTHPDSFPAAKSGDVVSVRMITYPSRRESAFGVIEQVIGRMDEKGIDERILEQRYNLETEFSSAALDEARACVLDVDGALYEQGRRDLRESYIMTIDPKDARDFDDAVSVWRDQQGSFHLGVHIADVSAYVPWGSSIDLDGRRRATSVYLVDKVIPMLPEELSCELCSLKPDVDRLAMTVDMVVDRHGDVVEYEMYPSVIRSHMRTDYDTVLSWLEGREPWPDSATKRTVQALDELAIIRFRQRTARGGLDFDSAEVKLALDEQGSVIDIYLRTRTRATSAVEEAMILANETVATYLDETCATMAYRVHGAPSKDSMVALLPLLQELDYPTEGLLESNPFAIQKVLTLAADRPEKDLINMRVLRSMKRASYSPLNIGHYGLASKCYCHFTSPIRRYPDLIVHRLLKAALRGAQDRDRGITDMSTQMEWLCRHCSEMERVAQDAAFDSVQLKLCEYMERFVGQTFSGIITSVSSAGLYVTLPNTVKGLVAIRTLGDEYFVYDPDHQTLTGDETDLVYHLGQQVQVRLMDVSPRDMTIDFQLV